MQQVNTPLISTNTTKKHALITLIGGDHRLRHTASLLKQSGYTLHTVGLGDIPISGIKQHQSVHHLPKDPQIIILPLPVTRDHISIQTPLDPTHPISWEDVKHHISLTHSSYVFGGRIPKDWQEELLHMGCQVIDYEQDETLQCQNAYITAEGALMTAMELSDTILKGASVAIIGYGRIGQALASLLISLGACVTVYARREASLDMARALGCATHSTQDFSTLTQGYAVIFNTVPCHIVSSQVWYAMPCHTLIVDLASAPFGISPQDAKDLTDRCGLGIVFAPALPGRYAPKTSGELIGAYILSHIEKGGFLP